MSDKLLEQYTLKITENLKHSVDKFTIIQKSRLNQKIRLLMAKEIHNNSFNPSDFGIEESDE